MKTIKNVYDNLLNKGTLKEIITLAAKGKKKRSEVQNVLNNIDEYVDKIYDMLNTGEFWLGKSHNRTIIEKGKKRELTISPFYPNRILDYIMVETLKPFIRKSMYQYCVGNVDCKGMIYGKKYIAKKYKNYKYYIKLDIHKFYPSTSSLSLFEHMKKKIKDKRFLKLCECLVLSETNLPIGSYYSQWFSNWYLQDLDYYIKQELKIPVYVRYVDDMVLLGNNKRKLLSAMYNINRYLQTKGLKLKRKEQVYTFKQRPLDFLGFRFCDNDIKMRTRNFKHLNSKIKHIRKKKHISVSQARSVMSLIGWLKQTKVGYIYYKNHVENVVKKGTLRRIISDYDRKLNGTYRNTIQNC